MNRSRCVYTLLTLACLSSETAKAGTVVVKNEGWTLSADSDHEQLQLSQDALGAVLKNARLFIDRPGARQQLTGWALSKESPNSLIIHTSRPLATWRIVLESTAVSLSSTLPDSGIEADSPAPSSRIVARTLDPEGYPVVWQGTSEVKHSFGGQKTQRASNLPRENADCMYFGLGQVPGGTFHALFDRKTDTVIDFGAHSKMSRSGQGSDMMRLSVPVPGNAVLRVIPDYYTKVLGLPFYKAFDDSHFKSAPMVWSSWTSYYEGVTEEDIVLNTDWLTQNLKPYGFQFVQLDDGYDRGPHGEHTWIGEWDKAKFPHGPRWLTEYIRAKGLRAGIWLVPNASATEVTNHPEWYLRDLSGKLIKDYSTPSLDSSNPAVIEFVKGIFKTLDDWGFDYYKLDGEFSIPAYDPTVDRTKLYRDRDPVAIYRQRLASIRSVIGAKRFIEDCPAGTPLNGIGYVDSVFNGDDLFANWPGMYNLFSSINANAFLNHVAVYLMPGEGLELAEPMTVAEATKKRRPAFIEALHGRENPVSGVGVTSAEARTVLSYVALTGVTYPLASVMPEVPASRVEMLKATMPTLPILPIDLFSRGTDMESDTFRHVRARDYLHTYPQTIDLKVSSALGDYDVVGLTNWTEQEEIKEVLLEQKLGLPANSPLLAFDFWNRKLVTPVSGKIEVPVPPHDTSVLLIHSDSGNPQVLGTSRHITGTYSLSDVSWDSSAQTLSGRSESVPADPYTVWVHVPSGKHLASATVTAAGKAVEYTKREEGELLEMTFKGIGSPVLWQLRF